MRLQTRWTNTESQSVTLGRSILVPGAFNDGSAQRFGGRDQFDFEWADNVDYALEKHDAEIAMIGSTSEDVDATLSEGAFGGAEETGQLLNSAARDAARDGIGLGEAMGRSLQASNAKHRDYSLLSATYEAKIPFTAHVTIGGDIAHFHPDANGEALGAASHHDFRLLADVVRQMNGGGVYLNVGSAVVLPEIFLKCVTLVRNLGHPLVDITTANFDFIQSYRPQTNVVRRPTEDAESRGLSITGHHELMIPLLAAMLIAKQPV